MCRQAKAPKSRVYAFHASRRLYCQFLEEDLKTPLPRKLTFKDEAKLFELAERGGYSMNLEGRQAIKHAIEKGRGGIWLNLTPDQYRKLLGK